MKIGIVTLNGYRNHGGRLQNYALEQQIISMGYDVETLVLEPKKKTNNYFQRVKNIMRSNGLKNTMYFLLLKVSNTFLYKNLNSKVLEREKLLETFSKKHLNETYPILTNNENLTEINKLYDIFIVGSDQVWNPNLRKNLRKEYFLYFADDYKKNSYAASFSINRLQEEMHKSYKKYLEKFKNISVREFSDLIILKDLGIDNSVFSVDPTLLLDANSWRSFDVPKVSLPVKKYILINILGNNTRAVKNYIKKNNENRDIINISDPKSKYYAINPRDFIYLIENSDYVITDSFHTSVFSYIFNKQFTVFSRGTMESRIKTLYKIIYNKEINEFNLIEFRKYKNIDENDYFKALRASSIDYLKKIIENYQPTVTK